MTAGGRWSRDRAAWGILPAAVLAAMGRMLGNKMVSDDLAIITNNPLVHGLAGLWRGFVVPYWPPPSVDGLYRPLALSAFTAEWWAGGGAPLVFQLVDLVLYTAVVLALWRLLRRFVPAGAALIASALFAVHPVHTEAVAMAVNQSELVVALIALWLVASAIDAERGHLSEPALWGRALAGLVVALGFKEHALVIPVLVALAIAMVATDPIRHLRQRAPLLLAMVATVALFWAARTSVLGDLAGARPALGLPASIVGRAGVMIGVVPTWATLLLWPHRLLIDYGPRVLPPWSGNGTAPLLGAAIIVAWLVLLRLTWPRRPLFAAGLLWIPIALAPVSNVLIPSGTWLGERTLFLASVGVALVIADLAAVGIARGRGPLVVTLAAPLLLLGVVRSARRMPEWADTAVQVATLVRDAPMSHRGQLAAGTWAFDSLGDRAAGERHLRMAIALMPDDPEAYQALADRYRADALCAPASALYAEVLRAYPARADLRVSLVACQMYQGAWEAAARFARAPEILPNQRTWFDEAARRAEAAAAQHARPGAIQPPAAPDQLARVGRGAS